MAAPLLTPASPADGAALPIDAVLDAVIAALRSTGRVVVAAEPASGKTTRVPLAVADACGGRVLVLEPRRVAARAVARHLAAQRGEPLGAAIGLSTRDEHHVTARTRVEFITEGVLTRRLQRDPELRGVDAVLFDEFHERSLVADTGLALALDAADGLRPELWIGVLSATIDHDAVAALLGDAPVVHTAGRGHPVTLHHRPSVPGGDLATGLAAVIGEALGAHDGDVLAFLPGVAEIRRTANRLEARLGPTIDVVALHGQLPAAEQDRALAASPPGRRRVVLATNVAETSLTVAGISVVVDSGLVRRAVTTVAGDPDRTSDPGDTVRPGGTATDAVGAAPSTVGASFTRLRTERVSRAEADQRAGRAGRLGPGHAYRLWSTHDHAHLRPFATPEIRTADLTALALELAAWGVTDPASLRWLDPPPARSMQRARAVLEDLGLARDGRLTDDGRTVASLGVDPRVGAILLAGRHLAGADRNGPAGTGSAVLQEAALLAALIEEGDPLGGRGDADIGLRLDAVRAARRGGAAADARRLDEGRRRRIIARAGELGRRLDRLGRTGAPRAEAAAPAEGAARPRAAEPTDLGALLLAGFADRVAQRRGDAGHRYRLRHGGGVRLEEHDPLARHRLLVVIDAGGGPDDLRELPVRLAAPLDVALLPRPQRRLVVRWDPAQGDGGDVVARWEDRLDALVLREGPAAAAEVGDELAVAALLDGVRRRGLELLGGAERARRLQQRVAFLRRVLGEGWPDLSDAALLADLDPWLAPYLAGCRRARDLAHIDVSMAMGQLLDHEQRQGLDRLAPDTVTIPSGRSRRIDYERDSPVVAAKLQEFFGAEALPDVAGGTVRLVAHLLSPAGRPVAVTDDLGRFWRGAYQAVRSELRGRYPKHPWPEDPLTAAPSTGTNRGTGRTR